MPSGSLACRWARTTSPDHRRWSISITTQRSQAMCGQVLSGPQGARDPISRTRNQADDGRGLIAGTTSGELSLIPSSGSTASLQTAHGPSPLLCLASSSPSATLVALAGKEVDVSIRDIERTFSAESVAKGQNAKGKNELEYGETWRAKNVCLLLRMVDSVLNMTDAEHRFEFAATHTSPLPHLYCRLYHGSGQRH